MGGTRTQTIAPKPAARRVLGARSSEQLRVTAPKALSTRTPEPEGLVASFLEADTPAKFVKLFHYTSYASLALFPVALILTPSVMNMPVDLAMGVVFPVHGHIGMNHVISDYVPKSARSGARMALLGVTGLTLLGFAKLNLTDKGITETVVSMWRKPEEKK